MLRLRDHDWFDWSTKKITSRSYLLWDHLGGFDLQQRNKVLNLMPRNSVCYSEYVFPQQVKDNYPNLDLRFSAWLALTGNHVYALAEEMQNLTIPPKQFKNFLCCFNRANQIGRQWLLAAIHERGWVDSKYCSKHFDIDLEIIKRHNIVATVDLDFYKKRVEFEFNGDSSDHKTHLQILSPKIQDNFITLVSETFAAQTTLPFWTEKFMYPVANKSLWIAFAAPGYHKFLQTHLGFKMFSCFDYSFDSIENHADRLKALLKMLKPFATMTKDEWHSVYQQEQSVLEHNYAWLRDYQCVQHLAQFDEFDETGIDTYEQWSEVFGIPKSKDFYHRYREIKARFAEVA